MDNKFLDYEGLQYYHSKITNFIETRPVSADQATFGGGLKVIFNADFENNPGIIEVQYWDSDDQVRGIQYGSGLFDKDGTYINLTSTLGTTLKDIEDLTTGDEFTFKVGNQSYTETITEYDYYMSHEYRVDAGAFIVAWDRENSETITLRFWPVNGVAEENGSDILNASTSVEFVSIRSTALLKDYIANESKKTEQKAIDAAVDAVESKWFAKSTVIKGLPELDWCLFEPKYLDKIVLSYENDLDGDAEDTELEWN